MGHQGVKNIDALINAHLAVSQWLQRFFCLFRVVANVTMTCWTVESWVSEYTFIGCMCPLPWPTYYFPKAFWNNHVTVNKTVIETAADEYHLHAPRGCSDTGENKQTLFCFFFPPLSVALFVTGGVTMLKKVTWCLYQICRAATKSSQNETGKGNQPAR